jgi:hypothetical protein
VSTFRDPKISLTHALKQRLIRFLCQNYYHLNNDLRFSAKSIATSATICVSLPKLLPPQHRFAFLCKFYCHLIIDLRFCAKIIATSSTICVSFLSILLPPHQRIASCVLWQFYCHLINDFYYCHLNNDSRFKIRGIIIIIRVGFKQQCTNKTESKTEPDRITRH